MGPLLLILIQIYLICHLAYLTLLNYEILSLKQLLWKWQSILFSDHSAFAFQTTVQQNSAKRWFLCNSDSPFQLLQLIHSSIRHQLKLIARLNLMPYSGLHQEPFSIRWVLISNQSTFGIYSAVIPNKMFLLLQLYNVTDSVFSTTW